MGRVAPIRLLSPIARAVSASALQKRVAFGFEAPINSSHPELVRDRF